MRIALTFETLRANGAISRRETLLMAETLRLGRGTDCGLKLDHLAISLHHATIAFDGKAMRLAASEGCLILLNGHPVTSGEIKAGDTLALGPTTITVDAATADGLSLTLREEKTAAATPHGALSLAELWKGQRRKASWILAGVILLGFLVAPILFHTLGGQKPLPPLDLPWISGPLSAAHASLKDNCAACHTLPFLPVRDAACTACHAGVPHHVNETHATAAQWIEEKRCATCHKEHEGGRAPLSAPLPVGDQGCVTCHADLTRFAPKTELASLHAFGQDHPDFHYTLLQNPETGATLRTTIAEIAGQGLKETTGLVFPHNKHLTAQKIMRSPQGMRPLTCADCHEKDEGGFGFAPIRMEKHCAECHALTFDPADPQRHLPHGDPAEAARIIREHFVSKSRNDTLPTLVTPNRKIPGSTAVVAEPELPKPLRDQMNDAFTFAFTSGCGLCHTVTEPDVPPMKATDPSYQIAPVKLTDRYLPKGKFNHSAHAALTCASCHAAETSKTSEDLLMPSVKACTSCHTSDGHGFTLASQCTMCHDFHRAGLPPLHPVASAPVPTAPPAVKAP